MVSDSSFKPADPDAVAHLALRVGCLLLANGANTRQAMRLMEEVGQCFDQPMDCLVTPDAIVVVTGEGRERRTSVGPAVPAMGVNIVRLDAVKAVMDRLRIERCSPAELEKQLTEAEQSTGYPAALVVAVIAITAASVARLFGADWPVTGAAFLAGLASGLLQRALANTNFNPVGALFVVAVLSGVVGALAVKPFPGASAVISLSAAGMILVPGVPLINGIRDLMDGHISMAVARLTSAIVMILVISFALFVAALIAGDRLPVEEMPLRLPVWEDMIFSATAAIGYSMVFNVPRRLIWISIACGMMGHPLRTALADAGLDLVAGSLAGAFVASTFAAIAAHRYRVPAVTFAFPGIVSMTPGVYGFHAAIGGLDLMSKGATASSTLIAGTFSQAITAATMTIAIGVGLILALSMFSDRNLTFPASRTRRKP